MKNKTVLVTGASRGIGKAIALKFAKEKYNLIINASKSSKDLLAVAEEVRSYGVDCYPILADVSNYHAVTHMFEEILLTYPQIDVIINNAGISHVGLFTDIHYDQWQHLINTNLNSVFNICHHAVPILLRKKSGHIINISSIWGLVGASCEVAYSTSKGAIHAFTQSLAKELGPSNIHVNAIACGAIDTSMNHFLSPEERNAFEQDIALCRFGKVEEVADVAYFLASENSSYLTGEIIKLDGGTI